MLENSQYFGQTTRAKEETPAWLDDGKRAMSLRRQEKTCTSLRNQELKVRMQGSRWFQGGTEEKSTENLQKLAENGNKVAT